MSFILKLLGGSFGSWIAGAVAVVLAGALATAGIQSARLKHAKGDLAQARTALVDPATKKTWQSLATQAASDLRTCRLNVQTTSDELKAQSDAVQALKDASDKVTAEASKRLQQAQTATAAADKRVASLLTAKSGPDACKSAEFLILEQAK